MSEIIDTLHYVGTNKKGERIAIEIPKEEEKIETIEPGYIDENSTFQLCYIRVKKFIEKPTTSHPNPIEHEFKQVAYELWPFVVYHIEGERGMDPLQDNNSFLVNGTTYQVQRELDFHNGITRETAFNFVDGVELPPKDPTKLYTDIKNFLSQYTWYDNHRLYDLETLYVIGTYFHQAFNCYPIFALRGPIECGKTRTNLTMCSLAYNALFSPNLSDAALYYARANFHCTLGLDERKIKNDKERNLLEDLINNAYKKGGTVMRISDDKPRQLKFFQVYGPMIYSSTKEMPAATSTRAIEVMMQVTDKKEFSDKAEPSKVGHQTTVLRNKLYYTSLKYGSELCTLYHSLSNQDYEEIANRNWELFSPFIALFQFFAPHTDEDIIISLIKDHSKRKTADKSEKFDYQVLLVLNYLINKDAELDERYWTIKDGKMYLKDFTQIVIEILGIDPQYCSWRTVLKALKNLDLYCDPGKGKQNLTYFRVDYDKVKSWVTQAKLTPLPIIMDEGYQG